MQLTKNKPDEDPEGRERPHESGRRDRLSRSVDVATAHRRRWKQSNLTLLNFFLWVVRNEFKE